MISYEENVRQVQGGINHDEKAQRMLSIFQGKWSILILLELLIEEPLRFSAFKKRIPGITNTMLTSTLRNLEELGLISRTQYNEIPPRVEYGLTDSGKRFHSVLHELYVWSRSL